MKRTKTPKKADAILTADFHLRETAPVSRTDDYVAAQERKLKFLQKLSDQNWGCPILCAGDVFHHWKGSPWLSAWAYRHLPQPLIAIPGNHDLPAHSMERYGQSTLSLLDEITEPERLTVLKREGMTAADTLNIAGVPFGELENTKIPTRDVDVLRTLQQGLTQNILMIHELVWERRGSLQARIGGHTVTELLEKFGRHYDLILTGDNHQSFTARAGDALLVNPGSMMRMTADQEDFRPQCFLYYADENRVEAVRFPMQYHVHSREHIDQAKERDERITAYIERMSEDWDLTLSFEQNLRAFFEENNVPRKVREIIWQHLETETT